MCNHSGPKALCAKPQAAFQLHGPLPERQRVRFTRSGPNRMHLEGIAIGVPCQRFTAKSQLRTAQKHEVLQKGAGRGFCRARKACCLSLSGLRSQISGACIGDRVLGSARRVRARFAAIIGARLAATQLQPNVLSYNNVQ
eukprot:363335-Chlamydomonas_euryale.AAC.5